MITNCCTGENMKIKIIMIFVVTLLLMTILPTSIAMESKIQDNTDLDSMMFCKVKIEGTGTEEVRFGSFTLGLGSCFYMKVDLEKNGYIEVSSITNPSNNVILEGSHQIVLIGFAGKYTHLLKTKINGFALIATWS